VFASMHMSIHVAGGSIVTPLGVHDLAVAGGTTQCLERAWLCRQASLNCKYAHELPLCEFQFTNCM
jgi:hypothetical protein